MLIDPVCLRQTPIDEAVKHGKIKVAEIEGQAIWFSKFFVDDPNVVLIPDNWPSFLQYLYKQPTFAEIEANLAQGDENFVPHLLDSFLIQGILERVSDLHFFAEDKFLLLGKRVDGLFQLSRKMSTFWWPSLLARSKLVAGMNLTETRYPQSGSFDFRFAGQVFGIRVATHPVRQGESLVIRILSKNFVNSSFENLGFLPEQTVLLKQVIKKPEGLFLIVGPTGSGKTTTLYNILAQIKERNICTLENPIEKILLNIRQTNITNKFSFTEGLQSILHQDPDVILVGEIRTPEAAKITLRAAMTGHLVFSTIHIDRLENIALRLRELVEDSFSVENWFLGALNQRLVRKFCQNCLGKGCSFCGQTGFWGRIVLAEIMIEGRIYNTFKEHLDVLVKQRMTSHEEAKRVLKID